MNTEVVVPKQQSIAELGECLKHLPTSYTLPVDHLFAKGLYGRLCFMKAGDTVVSRIHKQQHITVALSGRCRVEGADGSSQDIVAPDVWVTEPGTQRALYILEDALWLTVHATKATDPDAMMDLLTCPTYDDYLAVLPAPEGV